MTDWKARREEWDRMPKARRPKKGCWWCHGYGVEYHGPFRRALMKTDKDSAPCEVCRQR